MTENNKYLKYLKYKHKYLELKKLNYQLNGVKQLGGGGDGDKKRIGREYEKRKVKTIGNDGSREGMSLQCFWISILDYLRRNGHPQLTLRQLRRDAGLGSNTEHKMFTMDNGEMRFYNAATIIAEIYNLSIHIYTADRLGDFVLTDSPIGVIGDGNHLVELAQFGAAHFELIDAVNGDNYIPAVLVKGKLLMKAKDIDPKIINSYLELSECQNMLKIYTEEFNTNDIFHKKELLTKRELETSKDISARDKAIFLKQHDDKINKYVIQNKALSKKIQRLKEEISSLMVIISEFENS
jgi:hypothetical protein